MSEMIDKAKLIEHLNDCANDLYERGGIVATGTLVILRDEIESGTFDTDESIRLREALEAYAYWWPIKRAHGRGQAERTLVCGHIGPVGAPCCRVCAEIRINTALSTDTVEPTGERVREHDFDKEGRCRTCGVDMWFMVGKCGNILGINTEKGEESNEPT